MLGNSCYVVLLHWLAGDQQTAKWKQIGAVGAAAYAHGMFGTFEDGVYTIEKSAKLDYGPDQYAGQIFKDIYKFLPGREL